MFATGRKRLVTSKARDLWLHLDKGGVTVRGVGFRGSEGAAIGDDDLGRGGGDVDAAP